MGCAHGQTLLDFSHDPASRRAWLPDLAKGQLDRGRIARELGRCDSRRTARSCVSSDRPACVAVLRRREERTESLFVIDRGFGREYWKSPMVFPTYASRCL